MAMGDKGTLFVGTFDKGTVHAITGPDGQKVAKPYITGLRMPTGVAFMDGALYVIDIDKLYKYDNPEASLDKAPAGKVVYDDMPPYVPHGWKYLVPDGKGWLYVPFGPPCNVCLPPTSLSQYRRVNPANGTAELVAIGIRNSVGGAVDPRTGDLWFSENARDWLGDDMPSDKLNHVTKLGEHFGYPYCHQGDIVDPVFGMGHKCSEFTPPVVKLGPHVAPLGMKFYTGNMFPAEYKNGIFIAEHGSWNRQQEARLPDQSSSRSTPTARTPRIRSSPASGSTIRRSSAVPPISCRLPTARCWSPTTRRAPSTGSATRSSRSFSPPAATGRAGVRFQICVERDVREIEFCCSRCWPRPPFGHGRGGNDSCGGPGGPAGQAAGNRPDLRRLSRRQRDIVHQGHAVAGRPAGYLHPVPAGLHARRRPRKPGSCRRSSRT